MLGEKHVIDGNDAMDPPRASFFRPFSVMKIARMLQKNNKTRKKLGKFWSKSFKMWVKKWSIFSYQSCHNTFCTPPLSPTPCKTSMHWHCYTTAQRASWTETFAKRLRQKNIIVGSKYSETSCTAFPDFLQGCEKNTLAKARPSYWFFSPQTSSRKMQPRGEQSLSLLWELPCVCSEYTTKTNSSPPLAPQPCGVGKRCEIGRGACRACCGKQRRVPCPGFSGLVRRDLQISNDFSIFWGSRQINSPSWFNQGRIERLSRWRIKVEVELLDLIQLLNGPQCFSASICLHCSRILKLFSDIFLLYLSN